MKKILFAWTVISLVLVMSCQKFDYEKELTFDVSVEKTTFKAGEAVTFNFVGGDAHQISFFSGERGNAYEFRNQHRTGEVIDVHFGFRTHNTPVGDVSTVNHDLLISKDFNGNYDYESVSAATWVPLTDLFYWGERGSWQNMWAHSGTKAITDYIELGQPFYLAYRVTSPGGFTGTPSAGFRNFRVQGHSLVAEAVGQNYSLVANYAGMEWQLVHPFFTPAEIADNSGTVITTSIFLFAYYAPASPFFRQDYEMWGVSKQFTIDPIINMGADNSVPLKQYTDFPMESHTHYYEEPGVYKVVFIATNATISSTQQVIKELEITILPEDD